MRQVLRTLTDTDENSVTGKLLRLPLKLVPNNAVVTVRGGVNKGARWIAGSSLHSCWLGTYEADKQAVISKLVNPGMVVWDVGANAGFYTVAFSRLVGREGRVFAFEPFAENADHILRHLKLNELSNTVLVQAALSGEDGLAAFEPGRLNAEGRIVREDTSYLVPSYTADSFVHGNPAARPDLLKIDVEGAEADLLAGAGDLLEDCAPTIVLALHGEDVSVRCFRILRDLGYDVYELDGKRASDEPRYRGEVYAIREDRKPSET